MRPRVDGCTSCHINRIIFLYGIIGIMDFEEDDNDGDVGYVSSWREGLSFAMRRRGIREIGKEKRTMYQYVFSRRDAAQGLRTRSMRRSRRRYTMGMLRTVRRGRRGRRRGPGGDCGPGQ